MAFRLGDCVTAFNGLVDSYLEHDTDIQWLKTKIADLEDRSRRNNINFRVIPKAISLPETIHYLSQLLKTLLPL